MKTKIHVCPECGGREFITGAAVTQDWKVDQYGNFIEQVTACNDVLNGPDDDNIWTCAACGAEAIIVDEDEAEEAVKPQWKLLDKDILWIERQLGKGVYEYYRGVSVDPFNTKWRIGHAVITISDMPEADFDHSEAAIRADVVKKSREQFLQEFNCGSDKAFTLDPEMDREACMNRIIELSGICGDDAFLKFMLLNHEYDTEELRYYYIDDPDSGAFFVHSDARVAVVRKDKNIAYGIKSGDELLETFDNVRLCSVCGAPMQSGCTDEESYWCCDDEFYAAMDEAYGKGGWRVAPEGSEHCYEYKDEDGNWQPEMSYWTSWCD